MNSPSFNAWKLVSLSPIPLWALLLLAVLVMVGVAMAGWGIRTESLLWRRSILWTLRLGAGLAALFFLLEPGVRNLQVARTKNRVAILVDRSASMGFPGEPEGRSRSQLVADYLKASQSSLDSLRERFTVEIYGFEPQLSPVTPEQLEASPPRGPRTDLLAAIRAAALAEQGSGSRKLSGMLLFSDGADNVSLASGVAGQAKSALSEIGVPISTFLVGKGGLKDLAVEHVKVDDFAFVRNPIAVEAEIRGRGFKGQTVPVTLRREGQTVATKAIVLRADDDLQTVGFNFSPDQTGRFVYTVSVPIFPDEVVTENNTRSFVLKVIRDRIRVLLVVGRPSWDERFLRVLLRQDPNIDLVSFFILRTMSDDPLVRSDKELSLIPFPHDEIFDKRLDTFDVVIFQNFGYSEPGLSVSQYERNLERYVVKGGALVMIGGDHAFGEGRATFPILGQALPLEPVGRPLSLDSFKPRLTAQGLHHPVTAFSGTDAPESVWGQLPALSGTNITRAKRGATVLLSHPFQLVEGQAAPVLALWEYGRGRSMALTVDTSWYWAFTAHSDGSPSRYYERFWSNALRWLVRDPDLTGLSVTADPSSVEPGKWVAAVLTARTADYQPASGAEARVDLFSVETQKIIGSQKGITGSDGTLRVEFPPPAPGAYKLLGSAKKAEKELGEAEDVVAVRSVGPELSDASVRPDILEQIAKASRGRAYRLPMASFPEIPLLDPPLVEVGKSRDEPLWDRWHYLVLLVGLLGAEWMLRRRFGYI